MQFLKAVVNTSGIIKPCRHASSVAFLASEVKDFYNQPMILACPFCHGRFLVPASLFASGPREVHCARCHHGWRAEAPADLATPALPMVDLSPELETASSLPEQKSQFLPKKPMPLWLSRTINIGSGVLAVILILWPLLDRYHIAKMWSATEPLYDIIGLHIYHTGEGLSFEQVRSELRYNSGITQLIVEGKIHNGTKNTQAIPDILATAIGSDGKVMQSWQIDAPAARVFADEAIKFRSILNAPKGTVAEINLVFIEPKNE